ncbi:hypothetical protein GCM10023142_35180 [Anaerocolumna aminovalerica]|uniref:Methyltransferase domain-containing protein n=1 Tax=Anaerocolumna aminovalerica TaxID=1527 RepID=A0A1I5EFU9_9FIRM|nr:methyltransferase domain-containing protein [Anaerocolumna aminovalerica]SFO10364.1 protein of unknown function [Anaerocolumna aminovalerica]
MENIDLDKVIDEIRKSIKVLSDLDIEDKFEEISISKIINDITEQAENMVTGDKFIEKKNYVQVISNSESKKIKLLKKIDNRLRKLSIYDKNIRPRLRIKLDSFYNKKIIDGNELLKFEDEEFIDALYRSVLFREADIEGKNNALQFLRKSGTDKIDLINFFIKSDEGKSKNIKVVGIWKKKAFIYAKRGIYKIPILGFIIQFLVNICLLTKRLRNFQLGFDDIYNQIRLLNTRSLNIEKDLNQFRNSTNSIKQDIESINDRTKEIEHFKLESVIFEEKQNSKLKYEKDIIDRFYLRYNEVVMPDSREEVKKRSIIYIDKLNNWFRNRNKKELIVIDLGCGECEWVELLNDNGFHAKGVDSNSSVVKKVKEILPNINIEEIDAFSYLKRLDDNSVDILSSLHMVEHLDMIELIELLSECKRVLKSGGVLIVETPNPQNILTSTYYFNMDPTHKKPIPPELLAFLVNESGLTVEEKILLYPLEFIPYEYSEDDPIKDIIFRFNMEQAYSVLAVKR